MATSKPHGLHSRTGVRPCTLAMLQRLRDCNTTPLGDAQRSVLGLQADLTYGLRSLST